MKRDALEIKSIIKRKLESSNLILWGYTDTAKEFYKENKGRYHISGCVTEQREYPEYLDEEQTLPIMEWDKYVSGDKDYVVVFASPFVHIENQILASGLQIFEEYVDANLMKAVLSDKKIAIIAGACQVAVISDFLMQLPCFTDEYQSFHFPTHHWKSRWSLKSISYLKNLCDVYICMKHEEENIMYFSPEELPETCKIITVPYIPSRLYWPQMKPNWDKALNEYYIKIKGHGPFEYGDSNINRMMREGKNVEEIIQELTSDNFYSEEQVQTHIDSALRILEYTEEDCDVKVSKYIRENYKDRMLYWDMAHPDHQIIWEIILQLLDILRIDVSEELRRSLRDNEVYVPSYDKHCTVVPVYPSVAKHMGLNWWEEDMRYEITFYNGIKYLTFEEYIRAYYSVCSKFKGIMEEW